MKNSEILTKARQLIEKPENHIRMELAANSNGRPVEVCSPHAVRFCAAGAILCAAGLSWAVPGDLAAVMNKAAVDVDSYYAGCFGYINLNNDQPHEMTLKMFDLAIEYAKKEEEEELVHA